MTITNPGGDEQEDSKEVREQERVTEPIPEYSSAEEFKERRIHRYVSIAGEEKVINMDLVEPYKKIIQHAGTVPLTTSGSLSALKLVKKEEMTIVPFAVHV